MSDVVVTLPKSFGLKKWIEEGDAAGEARPKGYVGGRYFWRVPSRPKIEPGERVYVVYDGHLIGYAPLVEVFESRMWRGFESKPTYYLVRRGGAVAVTIDEEVPGFRGFRYRWWPREAERPFPEWKELAR